MSNQKVRRFPWFEVFAGLVALLACAALCRSCGSPAWIENWLAGLGVGPTPSGIEATPRPTEVPVPLQIKASELASDPNQVRKGEFVTLVVLLDGEGTPVDNIIRYPNLSVIDVLDADNRDVLFSGGVPERILLSISGADRDALLLALQDKKAMYLQSQGKATATSTPSVTPTPSGPAPTSALVIDAEAVSPLVLPMEVSALGNDPDQVRQQVKRGELVTLILVTSVEGETDLVAAPYRNIRVARVLDANGLDASVTERKPHTILLTISTAQRDDLITKLKADTTKGIYLQVQGVARIKPTAVPSVTPVPEAVTFCLPEDQIRFAPTDLEDGQKVIVVLVVKRADSEGNLLEHKAHRHNGATWHGSSGGRCGENEREITLALKADGGAVSLAEQLADATDIYIVRAVASPTPAPTAVASPTPTPTSE